MFIPIMNLFIFFVLILASNLVVHARIDYLKVQDLHNHDIYVSQKMLVSENASLAVKYWTDYYLRYEVKHLPPYPIWMEQPIHWETNYTINEMPTFNARLYWRFYSLMRHKASIATSCWNRNSSVFTSMTIVQVYHNPGEPFRIPCYICEKRIERDGRPKVFYIVPNRDIFSVNFTFSSYGIDTKKGVINLQTFVNLIMREQMSKEVFDNNKYFKYTSGIDWQIDQSFGWNLLNRGGDGLYMSPRLDTPGLTIPNYGTFFCLNEKAEPGDVPEVIVNVDVLTDGENLQKLTKENFITDGDEHRKDELRGWNLMVKYTWYPWSCASGCDTQVPKKIYKRFRKGIMSIYKINYNKPLSALSNLADYWDQFRAIEGYLSSSPYRENGIPLYSSLWLSFPNASWLFRKEFIRKGLKNQIFLKEDSGTTSSCNQKTHCEKDDILSRETSLAEDRVEVDPTPTVDNRTGKRICPIDMLKHKEIFVSKKGGEKLTLEANKAYKFFCGTKQDKEKRKYNQPNQITWHINRKQAQDCRLNYLIFSHENVLHVHRATESNEKQDYSCHDRTKIGEVTVVYYIPYDWRPFVVTVVVASTIIFLTCPLCLWCARGVKDVASATKRLAISAAELAVKAAAIGADAYLGTGGEIGEGVNQFFDQRKQQKEAEEANRQQFRAEQLDVKRAHMRAKLGRKRR